MILSNYKCDHLDVHPQHNLNAVRLCLHAQTTTNGLVTGGLIKTTACCNNPCDVHYGSIVSLAVEWHSTRVSSTKSKDDAADF